MPARLPGELPTVIYIAGYGRSGSTILDAAIAISAGGVGVGEVNRLFECVADTHYCECGDLILECGFWQDKLAAVGIDGDEGNLRARATALDELGTRVEKTTGMSDTEIRSYTDTWTALLAGLGHDANVVVDSSKTSRRSKHRIALLAELLGDRLFVVHLVRHPHAVLGSVLRGTNTHLEAGHRPGILAQTLRGMRSMLGWVIANRNARAAGKTLGAARYRTLKYEDFTANPGQGMQALLDWAGVDGNVDDLPWLDFEKADLLHGVSGNRLRRQKKSRVEISQMQEPRLNGLWRFVANCITGRERRRYYRRG